MFDQIADRYDLLNHLISFGMDKYWRRNIVKNIIKITDKYNFILDLASGTGDLVKELLRLNPENIISIDISEKMLKRQKNKINDYRVKYINTDAENIPFPDSSINILTVGFGIRNFNDLNKSLTEISRVIKSGGLFIVLEMFGNNYKNIFLKLYFNQIVPIIGYLITGKKAYQYLSSSVNSFITAEQFIEMSTKIGFEKIKCVKHYPPFVYAIYLKRKLK